MENWLIPKVEAHSLYIHQVHNQSLDMEFLLLKPMLMQLCYLLEKHSNQKIGGKWILTQEEDFFTNLQI